MLQNYEVDITDFIKITSAGVKIADYVQVRAALIKRYKSIYGSDIDVSTASADGIYITNLALIINNILQSVKTMYSNLDVNTANGVYLDHLCALANVKRKPATHSTASILIKNISDSTSAAIDQLTVIDKAGTEWKTVESVPELTPTQQVERTVVCVDDGPVEAKAGWIYETLEAGLGLSITQPSDAILGSNQESDAELRDRRAQSSGADGVTVLESLVGALLEISGIDDVLIYTTGSQAIEAKDGTQVAAHSVYVIIRRDNAVIVDNKTIGTIIYEKLTPGINSVSSAVVDTAQNKHYNYSQEIEGTKITGFDAVVYWKEAKAVKPQIIINFNEGPTFNSNTANDIGQTIIDYANNLGIGTDLTATNLLIEASGLGDYVVTSATVDAKTEYRNADTYYNYSSVKYEAGKVTIS